MIGVGRLEARPSWIPTRACVVVAALLGACGDDAMSGDVLDVQVNTVLVFPKISCFWFGETQFSLMRL